MSNLNRVTLEGNLLRDIEIRRTREGKAIGNTAIAVDIGWGEKKKTAFVDLTLWGKQAEIAEEHTGKGRKVFIDGRLEMDEWQDKNTGQKRSKLYVTVENFRFGDSKGDSGAHDRPESRSTSPDSQDSQTTTRNVYERHGGENFEKGQTVPQPDDDSDIPF